MSSAATNERHFPRIAESRPEAELQDKWAMWQRLLPQRIIGTMTQEARGIFVPYPLLAILAPILFLLIGGVIGLCTIVYSQNTTLNEVKAKNEQLEVYIRDDREKLIRLQTEYENAIRNMGRGK